MQRSHYVQAVPTLLAHMRQEREENAPHKPQDDPPAERPKVYGYRTVDGDLVFSTTRLDQPNDTTPTLDNDPQPQAPTRKVPPVFLSFVLLLAMFLLLDSLSSQLVSLMTPTATITIIPQVKTITLHSTATLGKLLSPLTISQSLTVAATGHGYQNATEATGTLTFYNGAFSGQVIPAGTVYTGSDGIQIATAETVTIPAASPPQFGIASIDAHALLAGASGNISTGDITSALSSDLLVKNLSAFSGGQDARDFSTVSQQDINTAAATLKTKVSASMKAALTGQLLPGEALTPTPCDPTVSSDHQAGYEAANVTVTVSQTCTAIVYSSQELQEDAMQLLATQAAKQLERGYTRYGRMQVTVIKATAEQQTVMLTFSCMGTWLYRINQQQLLTLIAGKPRQEALHLLSSLPGIRQVTITGIADNNLLPTDQEHIKILELIGI